MNDKIQYFTKNKNGWEPVKFEDGSSIPPKGLLQYKPSPFEIETQIEARRNKKVFKDLRAIILGYARPSGIKRTRKRQIAKAKHMMACHDQRVTSGHSGGTRKRESLRGGKNETN